MSIGLRTHAAGERFVELGAAALFSILASLGVWVSPWYLAAAWAVYAAWDRGGFRWLDPATMPILSTGPSRSRFAESLDLGL